MFILDVSVCSVIHKPVPSQGLGDGISDGRAEPAASKARPAFLDITW
jgi:hypothetical protein